MPRRISRDNAEVIPRVALLGKAALGAPINL
jgi:hypothetical protein